MGLIFYEKIPGKGRNGAASNDLNGGEDSKENH